MTRAGVVRVTPWGGSVPPDVAVIRARTAVKRLAPKVWWNHPGNRSAVHRHADHTVLDVVLGSTCVTLQPGGDSDLDLEGVRCLGVQRKR